MTAGAAILTSQTAGFADLDIGKLVAVSGAGRSGSGLTTTIASVQSGTQITLAATAETTTSSGQVIWGTDDTRAIRAAFIGARSPASRRFYFPQGLYLINIDKGDLLLLNAPRVEIFGDGIGLSVLQFAANITLSGNLNAIRVSGSKNSYIHDLSIYNGSGMSSTGSREWTGVALDYGAQQCTIERVEVSGAYGSTTAGGSGIAIAELWNSVEETTILRTDVPGGPRVATCRPGSMRGIYRGRRLGLNPNIKVAIAAQPQSGGSGYAVGDTISLAGGTAGTAAVLKVAAVGTGGAVTRVTIDTIGSYRIAPSQPASQASSSGSGKGAAFNVFWNAEQTIVRSTTADTFAAAFANPHAAGETLNLLGEGRSNHVIRDCFIHDGYHSTGIVVASSANKLLNNRIVNVGANSLQHGFYDQGGLNHYEGNYVEGVGGWSYHMHKSIPNAEASGCRLIGNTSVDPGAGHLIVDAAASPVSVADWTNYAANPQVPLGASLNRYVQVMGNLFRQSNPGINSGGGTINISVPATFESNVLEDGTGDPGSVWLHIGGNGSTVVHNTFRMLNLAPAQIADNSAIVQMSGERCLCEGNSFQLIAGGTLLATSASGCSICNNVATLTSAYRGAVFNISGRNNAVSGNRISGGSDLRIFSALTPGFAIHDNDLRGIGPKAVVCFMDSTASGAIYNNSWDGIIRLSGHTLPTSLPIYNNDGAVSVDGRSADALTRSTGRLLHGIATGPLTNGVCVKYGAGGNLATCTTADRGFIGISVSETGAGPHWTCMAGLPGTEYPVLKTDGPWAAGNVGVLSMTAAGKIHDTGSQMPPSDPTVSYARFLNSGTESGRARVLVVRTI